LGVTIKKLTPGASFAKIRARPVTGNSRLAPSTAAKQLASTGAAPSHAVRSKLLAAAVLSLAVIVPAMVLAGLFSGFIPFSGPAGEILFVTLFTVIVMGVPVIVRLSRRLNVTDGRHLLLQDPRPPVVYLRSFGEDDRAAFDSPVGNVESSLWSALRYGDASHESSLGRSLKQIGPFIAIGRPGERLAPAGAARLYVTDAEWQPVVRDLLCRAAAVILRPSDSPGTSWEMEQIAAHVRPERILLLVPNPTTRPLGFHRACQQIAHAWRVQLPAFPECDAIMFSKTWEPQRVLFDAKRAASFGIDRFVRQVKEQV
jgi:hypothetical protein